METVNRRALARDDVADRSRGRNIETGGRSAPEMVLRSWSRSRSIGLSSDDKLIFNPVARTAPKQLEERSREWLLHAEPGMQPLFSALSAGGWAVSVIDAEGYVVKTLRAATPPFGSLALAFRPGVNLGEAGAGTTGPACALAERQTVVVSGSEHFLREAREFTCTSAPIFDPKGGVVGVLNASSHYAEAPAGIPLAVAGVAQAIENRMVEGIRDAICFSVGYYQGLDHASMRGTLAFSADGELLGASPFARQLVGITVPEKRYFSDYFTVPFSTVADTLNSSNARSLVVESHNGTLIRASLTETAKAARSRTKPVFVSTSRVQDSPLPPEFGPELSKAQKAFAHGVPILIAGETGTGKEVMAQWLHGNGMRAAGPFVALNCSAIPASLIESELFGYEAGAFTGASRRGMTGKMQQANGGTLFLDEIGDMPIELQARLLRVIQERKVCRIGGDREYSLDIALISATHRDLAAMVPEGSFRQDLYYRIAGFKLKLPPLRARSDFRRLVDRILAEVAGGGAIPRVSAQAGKLLEQYAWPGNVRELGQVLKLASAFSTDGVIDICHLPEEMLQSNEYESYDDGGPLEMAERRVLKKALTAHGGNISAVARSLKIARATLYRKLKAYGLYDS